MKSIILFLFTVLAFCSYSQVNALIRGPYLQQTGPNSTYINWKTNVLSDSKILYGTVQTNLSSMSYINNSDTMHSNLVSGLLPNTKYYYTVNQNNTQLCGDTFYFYTAPLMVSMQKTRFLALGDCGSGYVQQYNLKSAINYYKGNNYINGILLLGDNAYEGGFQNEYQLGFFNPFKTNFILNQSCIYPSPGNHDYANDATLAMTHAIPYYDVFDRNPQNAELGGLASNHKEFYSFNYGNAHFISLDSYGMELNTYHLWDTLGPQFQWLEQDLQQDHSMWKIVYFHHPPFTMGSHNSDTEGDLILIRKYIARLLEKYGVDLVLNGHSHNYERSWLQKGHYNLENTFDKALHTIDSSSAKYDGTLNSCPYNKDTANNKGTIYIVAGEAGKLGATQFDYPHNSKYFSTSSKAGALFLEIEGNRLDGFYLMEDSLIHDKFTMFKNVSRHIDITGLIGQTAILSASWNGGPYNWTFNGATTQTQSVSVTATSEFIVHDSLNCLADTFSIGVLGLRTNNKNTNDLIVYPNPAKDKLSLSFSDINGKYEVSITDRIGKRVYSISRYFYNGKSELDIADLHLIGGQYFISLKISEKTVTKSFFIDR
ncbi:MAG: metallophosphoesterase [Bacteroidota bacterium]